MKINISSKLLRAFLALAECRNFTRAAELCHVSQSAFSTMIQRLEAEIGTRLFQRDTRSVTLTPEGELFVAAARHLVAEIDDAFGNLQDYVTRRKGRVGIAALPSITGSWLVPIIARYRAAYPGITVVLHDVLSDRCISLVREGEVDIAITASGTALNEFASEHCFTDRFFLICRSDHPLASRSEVTLEELRDVDYISLSPHTSVQQHIADSLGALGITSTSFQVQSVFTVAGLINAGLGVSLLPELTLPMFHHPELCSIPLAEPGVTRPVHILWRKDRPLSIAAETMLELIRRHKPM